jgi:sugar phosphate isomerase/epimerase
MAFPALMAGDGPYAETIREICRDDFFTAIEVGWAHDAAERVAAAAALRESHLAVGFGAQAALLTTKSNLNALDEATRQKAVALVEGCIDQAADLGARRVAVLSGPYPGQADEAKGVVRLVASLMELSAYARDRHISMTLETFDRNIDKKSLVGPTALAVRVSEAVRKEYPEFGLMLDLSHMPLLGEGVRESLIAGRDHLVHAHIGNCVLGDPKHPAYGDVHPRFGIAGGENDVPEVLEYLRVLFEIGFLGATNRRPFFSFEVRPQPGEDAQTVIANTKRVFVAAWAQL